MLLDTSGLLCLLHRDEPQHEEATQLYSATARGLTHSYVLAEFIALAHVRGLPRRRSLDFSEYALEEAKIEVVWVDETLHRQALSLLNARFDKTYSLCDAVSFVLMRERHIVEALTTDHHFEQEGFIRLLSS
ncbi:MAG: type II toxin-antitoxin system VapC family toxin [Pyrinomonadaceae bacterium]|jgi:predicted nucleic acid-binding protein|nr:type II toxin-antitoxin system VapC family toxin [Pyrinomonadaceae bacterium]MDQ3584979.1 PIN domain-containing protein [Acidobacteriota bacterium]